MNTPARILTSTTLALAALMASGGAYAALEPLDEETMSNSYAGDGTEKLKLPNSPFLNFANQLLNLGGTLGKALTREEFMATMSQSGVTDLSPEIYDGRAVTEVTLPSRPLTTTIKLSQFISSMTGVKYDAPGLGNITIQNFDAGGTRLWVWGH
jgi:hypothetical protein